MKVPHGREATRDNRMEELFRQRRLLNMHLCNSVKDFGTHGMPVLDAYEKPVPEHFIGFNQALSSSRYDCGIHFFIDDYQFERIWNTPEKYLPLIRRFRCIIAPDFSLYVDLPPAVNFWNVYRSRLLAAWWQSQGIDVIPSASWGNAESFSFCFDGLPHSSIIAVGHTAVGRNQTAKNASVLGMSECLRVLNPSEVLVYGKPFDLNFNNFVYLTDNINSLRHGKTKIWKP